MKVSGTFLALLIISITPLVPRMARAEGAGKIHSNSGSANSGDTSEGNTSDNSEASNIQSRLDSISDVLKNNGVPSREDLTDLLNEEEELTKDLADLEQNGQNTDQISTLLDQVRSLRRQVSDIYAAQARLTNTGNAKGGSVTENSGLGQAFKENLGAGKKVPQEQTVVTLGPASPNGNAAANPPAPANMSNTGTGSTGPTGFHTGGTNVVNTPDPSEANSLSNNVNNNGGGSPNVAPSGDPRSPGGRSIADPPVGTGSVNSVYVANIVDSTNSAPPDSANPPANRFEGTNDVSDFKLSSSFDSSAPLSPAPTTAAQPTATVYNDSADDADDGASGTQVNSSEAMKQIIQKASNLNMVGNQAIADGSADDFTVFTNQMDP